MARTVSAAMGPQALSTPTVLLVEARALVRMSIAGYLRECGYEVVETGGPGEARRMLEAGANADIAFIGLGEENDGFGLAQWIRHRRPNVRIVLSSGVRRAARTAADLCASGPRLAKPYEHRDLEARIRRLLAR